MTIARHLKQASLALLMLSSFAVLQSAYAVGTTAGTPISNTATVNYSVGTVAQAPITSNVAEFIVDSRIDLTVTTLDTAAVTAYPNQQAVVATFTVTNTGNSIQSYQLTATDIAGGTVFGNTDNLNGLVLSTAVDTNTDGDYDPGVDQPGHLGDIAPSATPVPVTVFVLANIPPGATNGQFASVRLSVRAATAGSNGATIANEDAGPDVAMGTPQVVWADAGENNLEEADSQYAIQSATLNVTKAAVVVDDGFDVAPNAKAIPGAIVEYTISITNNGAVAAADLAVTDTVPPNTVYVPNSLELDGSAAGTVSGSNISVPVPALAIGATATVTFQVTIQ
jgi:uncharacterized repeat protein (TIGR01451 family)